MHQECANKKRLTLLEVVVIALILYVFMLGINLLLYYNNIKSIFVDAFTLLVPLFVLVYMWRGYKKAYKYTLICEEFIVKQLKGDKEVTLLDINVNQIETIGKGTIERQEKKSHCSVRKFVNNRSHKCERYYCIYRQDGHKHYFEFEPSDKLIDKIQQSNY